MEMMGAKTSSIESFMRKSNYCKIVGGGGLKTQPTLAPPTLHSPSNHECMSAKRPIYMFGFLLTTAACNVCSGLFSLHAKLA